MADCFDTLHFKSGAGFIYVFLFMFYHLTVAFQLLYVGSCTSNNSRPSSNIFSNSGFQPHGSLHMFLKRAFMFDRVYQMNFNFESFSSQPICFLTELANPTSKSKHSE